MASTPTFKATASRTTLEVRLGKLEKPFGKLIYVKDGPRQFHNLPTAKSGSQTQRTLTFHPT